jgi:hypothetical protein
MSTPIQRFAIEIESMSGRSFDLTDFPLDNGFVYKAVQLFDSRQLAQADIDEDVAAERQAAMENLDDDEEFDEDGIKTARSSTTSVKTWRRLSRSKATSASKR